METSLSRMSFKSWINFIEMVFTGIALKSEKPGPFSTFAMGALLLIIYPRGNLERHNYLNHKTPKMKCGTSLANEETKLYA